MKQVRPLFSLLRRQLLDRLPQKYVVIILSIFVGLTAGLAAVLLKTLVHLIQVALTGGFIKEYHTILYFINPLIGLLIAVWLVRKFFFNTPVGHGIPNTLYAISKRNSNIPRIGMIKSLITSAITVGFGGSAGLEGPTVGTSAAIGSNIGRAFRVDYKTRTLLIGCAASAAMASMFNAPIAAIVFAIEVIMLDLTTASMIPLLLASVSAALTSYIFFESDVLFHVEVTDLLTIGDVPFYILLGIAAGITSLYFSNLYFAVNKRLDKIASQRKKAIIGGVVLGIMMFFLPALYGEGYETINAIIKGDYLQAIQDSPLEAFKDNIYVVLIMLTAIIYLKALAMTITIGSGGVGGIFAPALFMGSIMGFVVAKTINHFELATISETNFALVGMAGLIAGILHAPLTAIFLIAEITGGYKLFIPLMITTSIAYLTSKMFLRYSIYTVQLASRGELITHDKDQAVLTLMKLKDEIETNFAIVEENMSLGEMVKIIPTSKRNLFPVVDEKGLFVGMVLLNDIRKIMFDKEQYDSQFVRDFMVYAPAQVELSDSMDGVMQKFEITQAWNLPVIDNGRYIGFVSKSNLFSAYRKRLRDFYQGD